MFAFASLYLFVASVSAQAAVDALAGFGASTTGGGSASPVTVSSCSDLEDAVGADGAAVIQIGGILSDCGVIDIESDKTVIGVGSNAGLTGGGFRIKNADNVIIRNLKFYLSQEGDDLVALTGATNVWIDHNEFYNAGITGDKDYYDGLLDITHASDYVTVSWNIFHDHWKGSLVGHSDSNADEDTGHLRVTYHHNIWNNVNSRLPSLRFGTGHIYNSVFTDIPTSGINSRMGAQVLVESNVFNNVELAVVTDLDSDEEGYAVERNNVYNNATTEITQTGSWSPSYSYDLDSTDDLESILSASAGVGVVN
ncbi:polysaccharide lyase family 1 protein [Cylindrobasidium torrendii FP15055 ss-10]|uniref:Polysaccharide lyase family 1 protein n=1 Tax=Cylindrobasidium torrendii FP15055 ss-10 TaxID=1314674 RepID=A0A0D7BD96_9AGAR|nr:polysaccharide lyase family 1 protein [Cylindrobasidium torrendii FP15055 ss-10]